MRLLHILFFLTGVQLLINGVFFSSSLLTALGACLICLFILTAKRKSLHTTSENIGPSYHQHTATGKETYFAPLALLALIAGGLAYLFLPLTDIYEKTALTVLGMSFFYLILTLFIHGGKATMKNVLGIMFSLLFLLGLGRIAILWNNDYTAKFNTLISSISKATTGDTLSGDNLSSLTGEDLSGWAVLPELTGSNTGVSTAPAVEGLTYGQLIPYIANKYSLSAAGKPDVAFANISQNDDYYEAFKAAYYSRFFSASINPNKQVSCDNYVVFIGLAEGRDVTYTADNVYEVFRNEATNRNILYGCKQGAYVRWANLF